MTDIDKLYKARFSKYERVRKNELWKVLCEDFLQQYIGKDDVVVDLGAGSCEFCNNINAKEKIALDINPDIETKANKYVKTIISPISSIDSSLRKVHPTVFFASNLLEHLGSKEEVFDLLKKIFNLLRESGKLLIMQPDIKRVGGEYWDFFDHKTPITEKSLIEVLKAVGFKIKTVKSPFLPYSTKSRLPMWPLLLKIYLKSRLLQTIFGKQFFVEAVKG